MISLPFRQVDDGASASSVLFSSPHSGTEYPEDFLAATMLGQAELRSSEDAYIDELFASAIGHGATLLSAVYPRAYVDLNRSRDEMDPSIVHGAVKRGMNPRITAGLGVIPRVVAEGRAIMRGKISLADAERRLILAWEPYHRQLGLLLRDRLERHGQAVLFDCHSTPHEALAQAPLVRGKRPDVVLGDRFGASCDHRVMERTAEAFAAEGFTVARNSPFAGGFITQSFGRPSRSVHAIQIEIDRALYMNEKTLDRSLHFAATRARLERVITQLCEASALPLPLAAE